METVTGAGSGIGAAYATVLARRNPTGAGVILAARDTDSVAAVAERLGLTAATVVAADRSDPASLQALVESPTCWGRSC